MTAAEPPPAKNSPTPEAFRTEHDSMGEVRVPLAAKWQAQTQRAVDNFPVSGQRVERSLVRGLALLKRAAALENAGLGVLDEEVAQAVAGVAEEVAAGRWDDEFPVDVFQTGSGTSTNMNMNEVLATLATERLGRKVHPNDHVNASQSSNDMFPSAIHVAATTEIAGSLVPALAHLAGALRAKSEEFAGVVKAGRTHLMDATPVTLGQEFGGYAAAVEHGVERLEACMPRVGELPLGGTAVGTGLNAPTGFAQRVVGRLARELQLPLSEARDHFEAQGSRDALVEASGALRTVAVSLYKCATDLRWMGSGPRAGLAEVRIPDLQPGSSIMPGKVNPVMCEALMMVCVQVIGNAQVVAVANTHGNLDLNVMLPVIARNLLESLAYLSRAVTAFDERALAGLSAHRERAESLVEWSMSMVTSLVPEIGYDRAAEIAKQAVAQGKTVREVCLAEGLLSPERLAELLDPAGMTEPGLGAGGE